MKKDMNSLQAYEDIEIGLFSTEEYKQESPDRSEGSAELRQIFGGVKLVQSDEILSSSSDSDLSDLEEDDGMIFRSKPMKQMSKEERKEFLDSEHKNFKKGLDNIQIHSLWDFKCIPLNNSFSNQKMVLKHSEKTPQISKIPTL